MGGLVDWFGWLSILGTAFARVGKSLGQKADGAQCLIFVIGFLPVTPFNLISKVDRFRRIKDFDRSRGFCANRYSQ